jgi:hypothetical protein
MHCYKICYREHLSAFAPENTIASLNISNKCSIKLMLVTKEMGWLEVDKKFGISQPTLYRMADSKNKHVLENQKGLVQFKVTEIIV